MDALGWEKDPEGSPVYGFGLKCPETGGKG